MPAHTTPRDDASLTIARNHQVWAIWGLKAGDNYDILSIRARDTTMADRFSPAKRVMSEAWGAQVIKTVGKVSTTVGL